MASLGLVSPGAATDGVALFFLKKTDDDVCLVFFLNAATFFKISFGCHPLDGVTRGGPPPPLVTPLFGIKFYFPLSTLSDALPPGNFSP